MDSMIELCLDMSQSNTLKKIVLIRSLAPEIDVGLEMTYKIIKANCKVVYRSTYCGLKKYEKSNQAHIYLRKELYNSTRDRYDPTTFNYKGGIRE